jgi:diacylglycerol kinase (ATP)
MTPMSSTDETHKRSRGFRGLLSALGVSWAGFRHAMVNEAAIRQEIIVLAILVPISAWLPVTDVEHLILVLSMMLVVLVEFVNSAIESTVDRISSERHPLAGQAKDKASTAVAIAVLMFGLSWVVIVGPVVIRWIRG